MFLSAIMPLSGRGGNKEEKFQDMKTETIYSKLHLSNLERFDPLWLTGLSKPPQLFAVVV